MAASVGVAFDDEFVGGGDEPVDGGTIYAHRLRHTATTVMINFGVEPKILSDRVRHSNPNVTFQIYSHHSTGQDRAAAELIGRMIADALGGNAQDPPRDS